MKIEWASSFRPDGSRRTPPPSVMHGWLAKMRGTILGNERLRSKGMREMKDARALQKYRKERAKKKAGRGFFVSLFSSQQSSPRHRSSSSQQRPVKSKNGKTPSRRRKPQATSPNQRPTGTRRNHSSRHVSHGKR